VDSDESSNGSAHAGPIPTITDVKANVATVGNTYLVMAHLCRKGMFIVHQSTCSVLYTVTITICSSHRDRRLRGMLSVRDLPHSHHTLEVIRANDGILNTPAIDTACGWV
jgi:hypothetical protein